MKKTMVLLCLLFAAFLLSACQTTGIASGEDAIAPQAQATPYNYFKKNHSFEYGTKGWTNCDPNIPGITPVPAYAASGADGHPVYHGKYALRVNPYNCMNRNVKLKGNKNHFTYACYGRRANNNTRTSELVLAFTDINGSAVGQTHRIEVEGSNYTEYVLQGSIPEDTAQVWTFLIGGDKGYYDQCRLHLTP